VNVLWPEFARRLSPVAAADLQAPQTFVRVQNCVLLLAVAAYKLIKRALGGQSADSTEIDDLRKKIREQFAVGDPSFREGNTQQLSNACTGGDTAACAQLKELNSRHLQSAMKYIEQRSPDVVNRAQPVTIEWDDAGILSAGEDHGSSGRFLFGSRTIILARGYPNLGSLVQTLGHELLHAGQNPLTAGLMWVEDIFWHELQQYAGVGSGQGYIHDRIAAQAARIRAGLPLR
jgi:hypothetical protein